MVRVTARLAALRGRIGHRGAYLLFLALLDAGMAYALITTGTALRHANVTGKPFEVLAHYGTVLPLDAWGGVWAGVSLVCLLGAFQRNDKIGYACACFVKTAWALMYLDLAIRNHYVQGWLAMLVWLAFAATTLMISSWPEGGGTGHGAGRNPLPAVEIHGSDP